MNELDIKIIKLEPKDWLSYKEIRLESLRLEPQAFNSTYTDSLAKPDTYWIDELTNQDKQYLFATVNDEIVGLMSITFNTGDIKSEAILHCAYVNISFRRQGIGQRLLSALLEEAKIRPGVQKAKLWVKGSQIKARKFYESLGFSVTSKDKENLLIMEKSLSTK